MSDEKEVHENNFSRDDLTENNEVGVNDETSIPIGGRGSAFTRVRRIPNPDHHRSPLYDDDNNLEGSSDNKNNYITGEETQHGDLTENNEVGVNSETTIPIGGRGSAFTRVRRIPNPNYHQSNQSQLNLEGSNDNNNNNNSTGEESRHGAASSSSNTLHQTNNLVPGVQRIDGQNSNNNNNGRSIFSLPHAYPVPNNTNNSYIISSSPLDVTREDDITNNNRNNDDTLEDERDRKACYEFNFMTCFMNFMVVIVLLNIILYVFIFSNPLSSEQKTDGTNTNSTNYRENKTTIEEASIKNNDETQNYTSNFTIIEEIRNKTIDSTKQNEYNYTCYTDPMKIQLLEWDYYERGEDLSQKRTYIICPHTFMDIFGYRPDILQFDHGTGEVFSLVLFLPNVHVKCGLDGSLNNNCTFSGSQIHVIIEDTPFFFINYELPDFIKQENITIEGFRFTQASSGLNILVLAWYASFTVRNCLFDNNSRMYASIRMTSTNVLENQAIIENCTFVNNTYYHNPLIAATFTGWIPTIAIIMAYPLDPYWDPYPNWPNPPLRMPNDPDTMIVDLSVSNCVFHNNVFLSKSDTVIAAVINILPPFTSLSVTDSCFVDNKGYTSGVISISEGDTYIYTSPEPSTWFFSGNHFIGNMPKEDHKASCIVSRQYVRFGSNGLPERSELQEECEEYDDTTISTDMCLL